MILLNKNNFSVLTVRKGPHSPAAPSSSHRDFRVCLVRKGSAVWQIEDRGYPVREGDVILLNFRQKRHFTAFGEQGFELCALCFGETAFSDRHHASFFLELGKKRGYVMQKSPLSEILLEIYTEMQGSHPLRYDLASAKLTEFFIKLEKASGYDFSTSGTTDRKMQEILDYIDSHLASDVTLHRLASMVGLTESSLSRRFSAQNGISFKQYVIARRIERAITLLQTTDRKMVDVALECGFESISGFYDAFKKQTGTTPGKFSDFEI